MVDYGTEIINAGGSVVIDSTYKNHIYHSHGSSTVSGGLNIFDIDDIATSGLLFLKASSTIYLQPYGFIKNGSVYDKIIIGASASGTADWIVYEECDTTSSGYTLGVNDSLGDVVFSSSEKGYVNLVNVFYYNGTFQGAGSDTIIRDATNNYIAITGGGSKYDYHGNLSVPNRYIERQMVGFKKVSTNTINLKFYTFFSLLTSEFGSSHTLGVTTSAPNLLMEIKPPIGI